MRAFGAAQADRGSKALLAPPVLLLAFAATLCVALGASLFFGRYAIAPADLPRLMWAAMTGDSQDPAGVILWRIRLPRILSAAFVGAALSASGAAYQGIFKNPLVAPDILGASAGAALGAALGILMGWPLLFVQLTSFVAGLGAVGLACLVAKHAAGERDSVMFLVLGGILVGSLCMSLVSLVKYVADPYNKLPAITFWLMGSLTAAHQAEMCALAISTLIGMSLLLALRWRINVMAFGDEEALSLGINAPRLRVICIVAATLMTSASVAVCGVIGWLGLVVPHVCRFVVGPDHRFLIPAAALAGAALLLFADDMSRALFPVEIPLGILTSLVGIPFFLCIMARST